MKFTLEQVASMLGGHVEGDPKAVVYKLDKIETAGEGALTFLANPQYTPYIYATNATAVVVSQDFKPDKSVKSNLIRVTNPYESFARLLELYDQMKYNLQGIHPSAVIEDSAEIGENVYIGALAYVGKGAKISKGAKIFPHAYVGENAEIGENSILKPGSKVLHFCKIGKNCHLHTGVIVGSDGFGFAPGGEGYKKVPQTGNVIIEDDVEIGANCTIDRATLGSTIIRKGVKLDNLIQIAHNVEIGEHTVIAAMTGIAGSTKIGSHCMIGGQVGIAGHLKIGNNVKIAAQSGVMNNLNDGAVVMGSPAFEIQEYRKAYVLFRKLPKIIKEIQQKLKTHG
ncbi:UDP-3-O-acylglucosamine N-acyltransferase [Thermaurantimonas aggregans]|uniref:UDP-3-O-acylglucosamine N-acyltransferase n=1 Tax=Thermaurantimonas aggregans TaxID=2173829 RepID=A0A401XNX4_9FLAO|nr:UDP-3-O-(3-hydroxymyristoyl)glucosamine N-acyltransferase [Thermaurantimonas aggregans]MCX8149268.1 UDP-3-O-(3-hydroxymyristoyl)glucosamine N-acyltransferase [Thermaurantimonas aggregans]GCD78695.1 UDP-3-O-acylglucosamine N-acyltransferase [Thermaurantimonas aggregans]